MYQLARGDDEINKVLDNANEGMEKGSKYPGMSYEEGVEAVCMWLFGINNDHPFDD